MPGSGRCLRSKKWACSMTSGGTRSIIPHFPQGRLDPAADGLIGMHKRVGAHVPKFSWSCIASSSSRPGTSFMIHADCLKFALSLHHRAIHCVSGRAHDIHTNLVQLVGDVLHGFLQFVLIELDVDRHMTEAERSACKRQRISCEHEKTRRLDGLKSLHVWTSTHRRRSQRRMYRFAALETSDNGAFPTNRSVFRRCRSTRGG